MIYSQFRKRFEANLAHNRLACLLFFKPTKLIIKVENSNQLILITGSGLLGQCSDYLG
jgi:hypothetical protein